MILQKCIENRYSMMLFVPAKIRRKLGWIKGDVVQVYEKDGVLSFEKVKVTNARYKQSESKRGIGDHVAVKGKAKIR